MVHPKTPANPHPMLFLMVSNAFIVLGLGWAALRLARWEAAHRSFLRSGGCRIRQLDRGALYLPNVGIEWRGFLVYEVLTAAVAALLWLLVFRGAPGPNRRMIIRFRIGASHKCCGALCCARAVYVCPYFLAGTIIFPSVRAYYATQHIPSPGQITSLQFLLRGPLFILVCPTLLRMFRLPHLSGAVAVGLAFTLISGVAALILPNGIFPDTVRWAHFWEVSTSNFVFGIVVAWKWGQAQRVRHPAHKDFLARAE